jgi:MFS superfamily sulfate permease-like transporter
MPLQVTPPPDSAILVDVIEAPQQTLADIITAAVGISGVLAAAGVLFGLVLAVVFVILRVRRRSASEDSTDHQQLHLSI